MVCALRAYLGLYKTLGKKLSNYCIFFLFQIFIDVFDFFLGENLPITPQVQIKQTEQTHGSGDL